MGYGQHACQFHVSGISLRRSNQRRPEKYQVSHGHPRSDPDLVRLFRIDIPPTVFGRLFLPHLRGHKPAPRFALCVQRDDTPVPPCSHTPEYPLPRSLFITPLAHAIPYPALSKFPDRTRLGNLRSPSRERASTHDNLFARAVVFNTLTLKFVEERRHRLRGYLRLSLDLHQAPRVRSNLLWCRVQSFLHLQYVVDLSRGLRHASL